MLVTVRHHDKEERETECSVRQGVSLQAEVLQLENRVETLQ